jgi:hypothetical protein
MVTEMNRILELAYRLLVAALLLVLVFLLLLRAGYMEPQQPGLEIEHGDPQVHRIGAGAGRLAI